MSIIRSPRPESGFLLVSHTVVRDRKLTLRARGLLALLLSFPDNWKTSSEHLVRIVPEGRDAVRTALAELEGAGYLRREKRQDEAGRWRTETYVYDLPQRHVDSTQTEHIPTPENPYVGSSGAKRRTSKNDLEEELRDILATLPRVCGECDGTGWRPTTTGNTVERCSCPGGVLT